MQTIDGFLNLTNATYIPNIVKPDIVFNLSNGLGSDIIYIPETGKIDDFFTSQKLNNISRTESITVPARMLIGGETIITNKYYETLRKNLKGFLYSKTITKIKDLKRTRYFDSSPLINKMVAVSNKKTVVAVYNEFFSKIFPVFSDFQKSIQTKEEPNQENQESRNQQLTKLKTRLKILLIDVNDTTDESKPQNKIFNGFTDNLEYYLQIQGYKIKMKIPREQYPDFIIYRIDGKYYPIARYNETAEAILINKPMFMRATRLIQDLKMGISPEDSDTKNKEESKKKLILGFSTPQKIDPIIDIGIDLERIIQSKDSAKELKDYIQGNPLFDDLQGNTFEERLKNLQLAVKHAIKLSLVSKEKDNTSAGKSITPNKTNEPNKPDKPHIETRKEREEREERERLNEQQKLKLLQKEVESDTLLKTPLDDKISDLEKANNKLLKEFSGTIFLEDIKSGLPSQGNSSENTGSTFPKMAYNPNNIVNLKEFAGYDKQYQEFRSNLDSSITDLVMSLEKDKDLNIKVHKIESKIKDDNKTRYKLYTVQISHDFGKTHSKKYPFNIEVPYPVEGKYIKYGGNDYIMINQLFNQPIQKITPNLARLYTHYNTTSITLKNSKIGNFTIGNIFKEVQVNLKNLDPKLKIKIQSREMTQAVKDSLPIDPSQRDFTFEFFEITTPNEKYTIDLTQIAQSKDGHFYSRIQTKPVLESEMVEEYQAKEFAYIQEGQIQYIKNGDPRSLDIKQIEQFLLGILSRISRTLTNIDILKKSKSSVPFFDARIIGKNIPVMVLLVSELGFAQAMAKIKVKWTAQETKVLSDLKEKKPTQNVDPDQTTTINIPITLDSKRGYLTIYPKTIKQKFLCHGLLRYKIPNYQFIDPNAKDLYDAALGNDFGEVGYYKFKESISKIIDNTTEKILREKNLPTDVLDLYSDTIPTLLLSNSKPETENLKHYRIRLSESISHIGYKQLQMAMTQLKRKKNFPGEKLIIKPDFIMKSLLEAGILQQSKTINPLEELMLSQKVIKTGIGNMRKEQVTLAKRDIHPSYFGVISPTATNEYGGIGANQTLTNSTTVTDRFGSIQLKEYTNTGNPFGILSPVESLTTFMENTDTTRRVMGNQQTGQFAQLENPDESLVQTGFEAYIPQLVSSRFSKRAKITGQVHIENGILTVIGSGQDQGKVQKVPLRFSKSRTKRGVYLMNEYILLVNDKQKVQKGNVLACTSSLKGGKLAIGKNLVVAEMGYSGYNYEDGWVVSDEMTKKYQNHYLQKIVIKIPEDVKILEQNLRLNKKTEEGDILFSYVRKKYLDSSQLLDQAIDSEDQSDDEDDVLYGLEQHGSTSKYYSPGGEILEIVVKLNTTKPDPQLKLLYQESIKDLNHLMKTCELQVQQAKEQNASKNTLDTIYHDCMGNTDNISSLKIGGHKIAGDEPGSGIIEVYIKRENKIGNGSKFTLGNSGGKGTVQYIIPKGKTPIAHQTKLPIDFIPTSLSIVKRKNTDIYFNMYLGKCIYFLNEMAKELAKSNQVPKIKTLVLNAMSYIDATPDKIIVKEYQTFFEINTPEQVIKAINSSHSLNRPLFVAIKPPFSNKIGMRNIVDLAKFLNVPLKEKILIPENDGTLTMKKVPVGILNVYFLEHFPQMQGSMRGSQFVKNSIITGQGSSGAKDRKGATKTGLYDLYSLLSKTPYNLIKELHSLKSDAKTAKRHYQRQLFQTGRIAQINDIQITRVDTTTKNYIETLLLAAGLKSWY